MAPTPEAVCANIGVDHHEGALDQVFASLDQNGDGKIDPNELKEGLEKAGLELTDKALNRLTETYGGADGCLKQAGLLEMLAAVRDHKFHSFQEEAPVEEEAPEPPKQTPIHYVFSDIGLFEGAVDAHHWLNARQVCLRWWLAWSNCSVCARLHVRARVCFCVCAYELVCTCVSVCGCFVL